MLHPSPPRRELAVKLLLIALSKKAPSIWVTPARAEPCRRMQPCSLGARRQAHRGNDGEKCKDSKEGGDIPKGGREGGETPPKISSLGNLKPLGLHGWRGAERSPGLVSDVPPPRAKKTSSSARKSGFAIKIMHN